MGHAGPTMHRDTPQATAVSPDAPIDVAAVDAPALLTLDLREPLRTAAHQEADRRRAAEWDRDTPGALVRPCPAPDVADELIGAGLRTLARRYHPDAGGSHDAMIAATAAADWWRAVVRGLAA